MLKGEEEVLEVLNDAGAMATGALLERFDTDGPPLRKGNQLFTSKGTYEKNYQTPYGVIRLNNRSSRYDARNIFIFLALLSIAH